MSMNPKTPARRLQCFMEVVQCREVKDKREVNTAIINWLRKVTKLESEFKESLSPSLRTALLISMLPKDTQASALQQVDMKEDSDDPSQREDVFKDIIANIQSVFNSEVARSTPTMGGVTVGQAQAAQAAQGWGGQGDWGQDE